MTGELVSRVWPSASFYPATFRIDTGESIQTPIVVHADGECASCLLEEVRSNALSSGYTILEQDGTRVWRNRRIDFDANASTESARYTWHEDGKRVRCAWYECRKLLSGEILERRIRSVWIDFERI